MENLFSGPRQRQLRDALKVLGDVARYHGVDLQGKQVQKLLDDARDDKAFPEKEKFKLIKCLEDDPETHNKFVRAFTTLANAIDALKLPIKEFKEEYITGIKLICENWGKHWPIDFPHKNITPKGHVLSYVIPKIVQERIFFTCFTRLSKRVKAYMLILMT